MFPWIKQVEIFLIVCFMIGTTTAYNLPWWSHYTAQNIDLSHEKPVILRRVERVAETDEPIKQENRDIVQLAARVGDVTMNTTQGVFISDVTKGTQIEQNISTAVPSSMIDVTSKTMTNTETINTIVPLIHVESTHQNNKLNRSNFNKPLSFIIEPHVISESLNHTSFPATSVLPETVDLAPGLLNSTTNAKTSVSLSSTHMDINCVSPAHIVGNVSTDKSDTLDGFKSVLNTNVSQDGLSENMKDLTSKNSKLRILAGNISNGNINNKEMESNLDGELENNEQPGMFRKFLEKITINPDDMEPRETQDKITNSDILTALVFPIFMVVLVGVSLYTIHNMRGYFILRFPHRYNGQDPPHPPNNDDSDIPLDSITIPISQEQNEDIKVEISNEKEEIEETDLLKPVRPAPQLDNIKPTQKIEDKKLSRSSLRSFLENPQQDEKEDMTEEKIQHRSSFRNFLDEIMNDQNKPEEKLEVKEKERDLELEQHPTE